MVIIRLDFPDDQKNWMKMIFMWLYCYINPVNPDEKERQKAVAKFIEHLKYAKVIGADMVGTETGRYDAGFKVVPYTYTEGCYQLLLKSMREIVSGGEKSWE